MKDVHIISGLILNNRGLLVKDENNKFVNIHRRQGMLDGACAVYSLVMNLLYLGLLNEDDMKIYNKIDKRTTKGKFLAHLLENQGLIRDGYHYKLLVNEINDYFGDRIAAERIYYKDIKRIIKSISSCIEDNIPAIISVCFKDGGSHALLAIGKEVDAKGEIIKLFCLDPGLDIPSFSYWNCIIDISSKSNQDYPFGYITEDNKSRIYLRDIIRIDKK